MSCNITIPSLSQTNACLVFSVRILLPPVPYQICHKPVMAYLALPFMCKLLQCYLTNIIQRDSNNNNNPNYSPKEVFQKLLPPLRCSIRRELSTFLTRSALDSTVALEVRGASLIYTWHLNSFLEEIIYFFNILTHFLQIMTYFSQLTPNVVWNINITMWSLYVLYI